MIQLEKLSRDEIAEHIGIKMPEIIKRDVAAKLLRVSPGTITAMIINGTLPIGSAYDTKEGRAAKGLYGTDGSSRTIVVKERLKKWLEGKDLEA